MTGNHVESSAEEITQPSKMDKNVLLSRSQNWYVSVGVVENSLKDNVGLVSSHGHRCLHSLTVPPLGRIETPTPLAYESRRLLSQTTHALTKRHSCLFHVLITDCLSLQHRKQWYPYEVVCNRHQRIVVTYTRKKHVLTNHVHHSWFDCRDCLLAGGKASVYYNCVLWCLYPQSPLARLSPRETN